MLSLLMVQGSGPPDGLGGLVTKAVWLGMQPLALRSLREVRAAAVQSLSGLGAYPFLIVRAPRDQIASNSTSVSVSSGYLMIRT